MIAPSLDNFDNFPLCSGGVVKCGLWYFKKWFPPYLKYSIPSISDVGPPPPPLKIQH